MAGLEPACDACKLIEANSDEIQPELSTVIQSQILWL